MEDGRLLDSKLYELVLKTKSHMEDRRDEINKYYPSLFSAIIAVMPFLNQFNEAVDKVIHNLFSIKIVLILLSIIGIIISISWILTLVRISNYLEGMDKLLIEIEKRNSQKFISYIADYLEQIHSPQRITKQAMLIPYTFIAIFITVLVIITL